MVEAWDRRDGEPGLWYARFEAYRLLGPARTLEGAYRATMGGDGPLVAQGRRPGHAWRVAWEQWNWQARAEAWDAAERERVRKLEAARRSFERERRLGLIDKLLKAVESVMDRAAIQEVDEELARKMLPVMRGLLRDLMTAQRIELGEEVDGDGEGLEFTAEELTAAMKRVRLAGVQMDMRGLGGGGPGGEYGLDHLGNVLAELYPDEASVRRVVQEAGLHVGRVRIEATAVDTWHGVLMEAIHTDRMPYLWEVALREYGRFVPLMMAIEEYKERMERDV